MLARLISLKQNWAISAILFFYLYLAVHALSGNQGLMRWVDYEDDIKQSKRTLTLLRNNRLELEARASELRAIGLDRDILDARAREKIFVSYPYDYVIFLDRTP